MKNEIRFLSKVAIFDSFSGKELAMVHDCLNSLEISKNEKVFNEGDEGNEFFIVKSGSMASSIRLPEGGQREIAVFKAGDFFGEMAIFDNATRSATCYSKEDSIIYKFRKTDFFKLLESYPDLAIRIMYKMLNITTQRLKVTSLFLSDMVRWGNDASRRAITDELTGIYNRRYLESAMEDYFLKAKAGISPLTMIMVDIDFFREINNLYSHQTGDKLIVEVVKVFKKHLREQDSMARYGGDEFTVIMQNTGQKEAWQIAEKIRIEVSALDILKPLGGDITSLSLSMGLASFPDNADNLPDLRTKADQALYKAKENGRNRVVCVE